MPKPTQRVKNVIAFIEKLLVPSGKGAGKPFKLRPFQKRFIRDIYGKMDGEGKRLVRRAILSLGRKNGKTTLTAALVLVHLVGPEAILNGEIYSAANDREQASLVFRYASQLVRANDYLMSLIRIVDSTKTMICYRTGSIYRAISAEAGTKYGLNPSLVIYDELAQAKKRDLYDVLDTSMAAREEPLFIVISTQSNDPQHILSQLIDDGLSGNDPTTVCHLYAVPDDADDDAIFKSRKLWRMANPALGDFRSLDEMRTAAKRAKRMPSFETAFRNLYLNQRVDATAPLISRADWEACLEEGPLLERGERIYLGLDLSSKTDLTALIAVSAEDGDRVKAWFWKPGEALREHATRDRVPYDVWKKEGWLDTSPGRSIDYDFVAGKVGELTADYEIAGLAYDRWGIDNFIQSCRRVGLEADVATANDVVLDDTLRLVSWGQGFRDMAAAIDALEVSVLERRLKHDGNPCLRWNMANAMVVSDPAGNRKLDKSKARFRIDGAVALAMAIGLKSRDLTEGEQESAYDGLTADQMRERMLF